MTSILNVLNDNTPVLVVGNTQSFVKLSECFHFCRDWAYSALRGDTRARESMA